MAVTGTGRKELLATIEYQKDKIAKYETKLTDLVKAYKGLSKEKDALQASLKALLDKPVSDSTSSAYRKHSKINNTSEDGAQSQESEEKSEQGEADVLHEEISSLKNKIATLTSTLHTLSDEKSKLEISVKSERRRILDEKRLIEQQLQKDADTWATEKKESESKLHELRSKLIVFQHDREKETANGIMMLREVESRLAKERNEKEKIEKLLDDTQEQNRQFALAFGTRSQEKKQHKQIVDLQNELEQVRCRLKKAEQQCNEPPMLKILQDQMDQMKTQYTEAIFQEQKRAEAAENSVRKLSQTHEERVVALESSLAELSISAANYDRNKQSYIETINTLKEKISELAEENMSLTSRKVFPATSEKTEVVMDGSAKNTEKLVENFTALWKQLCNIQEKEKYLNVEELLSNNDIIHSKCVDEYNKLEKELQDLRCKAAKDSQGNSCLNLKEQNDELRGRIRSFNSSSQLTQKTHQLQVNSLKEEIKTIRKEHEDQLKQLAQEHKGSVNILEQQLTDHCQRSLITLQDREEEIHRLSKEIRQLTQEAQMQPSTVAAALLSQVNTGGADGPLLHHLEDIARKELEVSKLRREKIQLEKALREVQMAGVERQQAMQETIDDLREEVQRLIRNTSRKGENLEYLKNVVLRYMTSTDAESRHVILNAISAVLKFTPEETQSVRKNLDLWWWQAPSKEDAKAHRIASIRRTSFSSSPREPKLNSSEGNSNSFENLPKSNRQRFLSLNKQL